MRVMLDVFSGRPNPEWTVSPALAQHVRQLLARQGGPAAPDAQPHLLGYRGLLLQATPDDGPAHPLPPLFRLGPPAAAIAARGARVASEAPSGLPEPEREAAAALLDSAHGLVERELIDEAMGALHPTDTRAARPRTAARTAAADAVPDTGAPCELLLSAYRPWFWNAAPIRLRNNCYNYASNFVSNAVAQPGRRVGRQYDGFSCEAVGRAALADGYRTECDGNARMVALAVWPGRDFHWYRLHDGFWAHKLGIYSARNVDNQGRVIAGALNPATCDRGPYVQFCRYLFVPPGVQVL
jgi:hypothetical protein